MNRKPTVHEYASWILAAFGTLFVLCFHLLPALIAGLLVFELVHVLYPVFARRRPTRRAKGMAVFAVLLIALGLVAASGFGLVAFLQSETSSLPALLSKMAEILEDSRAHLPQWVAASLPRSAEGVSATIGRWLREHATELQQIGRDTAHILARVLIGMVIGAIVSLRDVFEPDSRGPLSKALAERVFRLGEAFRHIVFAQVRISAINTLLTALYLAVVLPLFDVHLPLTKTMIAVTFIAGLLPVVGNLISNTVVFIVSLAHSPVVAVASLGYLVLIHKLEYFLNARIVGNQIKACAWELLTAMLVMESAFGLAGLAAAPICYAWLKDELNQRRLL